MASLGETIQLITGIGALIVGIAYVVGGLIVNVHLSRYGVTEYQILRVKYLVVGLVYIASMLLIAGSVFVIIYSLNFIPYLPVGFFGVALILSLIAVVFLLVIGADNTNIPANKFERLIFGFWTALSLLAPLAIISRNLTLTDNSSPLLTGLAFFIFIVGSFGQLYSYAHYMYGNETNTDVIGMGIPVSVQIAIDKDSIDILQQMGIAMVSANMTGKLSLMDETDEHFLIKIDADKNTKVVKIDKKMVKGIVYLGVHKEPDWLTKLFRRLFYRPKSTNT